MYHVILFSMVWFSGARICWLLLAVKDVLLTGNNDRWAYERGRIFVVVGVTWLDFNQSGLAISDDDDITT